MGVRTTNNTSKRIKDIIKNCNDLRDPLKIIARDMKNETLRNFDNEKSYLGVKWKKSNRAKKIEEKHYKIQVDYITLLQDILITM